MINDRVEYLDYLRFLAIIPVLMTHYLSSAAPGGYLGVNVFFCLSGYFIAILLMRDTKLTHGYFGFLVRRLFRIMPMYYVALCSVLFIIWLKEGGLTSVGNLTESFLMLNVPVSKGYRMGFFWTLHVEFWFYLLFPILFLPCRSNSNRMILCVLIFVCSSYLQFYPDAHKELSSTLGFPRAISDLVIFANNFVVGAFVAVMLKNVSIDFKGMWVYVIGALSLAVILYLYIASGSPHEIGKFRYIYGSYVAVATGVLIVLNKSSVGVNLRLPGAAFIGVISYSLYLIHLPILELFSMNEGSGRYLNSVVSGLGLMQRLTFFDMLKFFAYCTVMASITYYMIERPSMSFGRSVGKKVESFSLKNIIYK